MSEDKANTINVFAIVLAFYHSYKRDILLSESENLTKIARKYHNTPDRLLLDLTNKYPFPLPNKVSLFYLHKIMTIHKIPPLYVQLLPTLTNETVYNQVYDIYSIDFDPLRVLNDKKIISNVYDNIYSDNINSIRHLIFNNDNTNLSSNVNQNLKLTRISKIERNIQSNVKSDKDLPLLKSIPLLAMNDKSGGQNGPFSLLFSCINDKCRVRILIRRLKGVKAILNGFIKAFDRHWNILLSDVDEIYVPLSSKKKFPLTELIDSSKTNKITIRKQIFSQGVMKRYLPQLLKNPDNFNEKNSKILSNQN